MPPVPGTAHAAFVLPVPYQPGAARLSPHADAARAHSTSWARAMGLLGQGVWDEAWFGAMAIPLLAAYGHPDAAPQELELASDWYVWAYWFDDHFTQAFKGPRAPRKARAYLHRLSLFTPSSGSARTPRPSNAGERALADLWSRTNARSSPGWRSRFAARTQELMRGRLHELENVRDGRVPTPIELIGLRRASGGASWAADLAELVSGAELPADVVGTRAVRVLRDTFADGVHLLNDLYSYRREVAGERAHDNGVLVVRRFLGCGAQEAADRVNELRTSRLRQFEAAVASGLPALVEGSGLDQEERGRLVRYVQGLRDWQAGAGAWHRRSSRYLDPDAVPAQVWRIEVPAWHSSAAPAPSDQGMQRQPL
ncbi:terpene synthase family protein [[Actinomadura] parvosata]|uniref:terpene synthase family protein n=1 Tax=[Actinomadura] parvosata TaxID=1955412 RepID=UPI00406C5EE2